MSKERPILFSAPMVRAILEGRKTQTRRVLRVQPLDVLPMYGDSAGTEWVGLMQKEPETKGQVFRCKLGRPGDLLWVRESWRIGAWCVEEGSLCIDYRDGPRKEWIEIEDGDEFEKYWIQCSEELDHKGVKTDADGNYRWEPGSSPLRWRSPIHMPRWASRITLRIKSVRVERLNQISREDAIAEGVHWKACPQRQSEASFNAQRQAARIGMCAAFVAEIDYVGGYLWLWESINGPDSWAANPWVWVVEFERVESGS